jgi:NAD(P)-dependent dehydrogenase (short-subunit alcohol dehydrogenase family)
MNTTQQPVAIVTGASSGIGLGVTQTLLERGWHVVGTSSPHDQKLEGPYAFA